jgi:Na+-driven multidrug efflux pump
MAACGWTFIVGVGWMLATEAPQLGAIGPWIGAAIYIIVSGVGLIWRFESGRWRTIKLITDTKK